MPPLESLKDSTTLSIAQISRHLEQRPKSFLDLSWWPSVAPLRNVQRAPKTLVLSIQTCNHPHHIYCRKNVLFSHWNGGGCCVGQQAEADASSSAESYSKLWFSCQPWSQPRWAASSWVMAVLPMLIFCISNSCVCLSNGCAWEDSRQKGSLCH